MKKFYALEKQHKQAIHEIRCLEVRVAKMKDLLHKADDKRKKMELTLKEDTEGRLQLQKMIDDARHAQTKAMNTLKERGIISFQKDQRLKAHVAALEAKWQQKLDTEKQNHERRVKELEGAIELQKVAFMEYGNKD